MNERDSAEWLGELEEMAEVDSLLEVALVIRELLEPALYYGLVMPGSELDLRAQAIIDRAEAIRPGLM